MLVVVFQSTKSLSLYIIGLVRELALLCLLELIAAQRAEHGVVFDMGAQG